MASKIFQSVTGKLTWTHYCELMGVSDSQRRSFYEHEAANSGWSVREMRRQMDSMLFERLLKAKDEARREHVMALANEGVVPRDPADIIREPYVLEFLGLPVSDTMILPRLAIMLAKNGYLYKVMLMQLSVIHKLAYSVHSQKILQDSTTSCFGASS